MGIPGEEVSWKSRGGGGGAEGPGRGPIDGCGREIEMGGSWKGSGGGVSRSWGGLQCHRRIPLGGSGGRKQE